MRANLDRFKKTCYTYIMSKIVPVITLLLAAMTLLLNIAALICASISPAVPSVAVVAVPASIAGLVAACLFTPFAYMFKKDILCKISMYMDLVSLFLAIAAVSVGFSVL